jgi:hypothetical protein
MIIANHTTLPDGRCLTHLYVEIYRSKHTRTDIYANEQLGREAINRWICAFFKAELTRFVNQRAKAYEHINLITQQQPYIDTVRTKVLSAPNLLVLCNRIDAHQQALRALLPSDSSPQASWTPIIEYIIHHAHHAIYPKQVRQVCPPDQVPAQPGN